MRATYSRPTGFGESETYNEQVTIVGYCYGYHRDARGYDREGDAVLAVFIRSNGTFGADPISNFKAEGTSS